ncbi:MAG: cytochrome b/b6 domain-containing protein [Janthinobacterium lividum]
MKQPAHPTIQPWWVRLTHWLTALAVVVMVSSGLGIYDASPIFPALTFPGSVTLGGWLGGALLWHFAAMWVLFGSLAFYLAMNVFTGRFQKRFLPFSPRMLFADGVAALRGKLGHADLSRYNAVQKFAYLTVSIDLVVLVLSGLVVWKSVQFPLLRGLMGGYDSARVVHFFAMTYVVAFFIVHVVMVALVPRSLLLMTRGR